MEMTIRDFIEQQYPIKDIVKVRMSDPIKEVMNRDSLPYDKIGMDENGQLTKMVEIDEGSYIPVVDLISYTAEEIERTGNDNLKELYKAYMSQIDVQDVEIADIMASARRHEAVKRRREALLNSCTT